MRLQLMLLAVLVTACDAHTSTWRITSHVPSDPAGFSNALYQSTRVTLKPGHRVELVNNGAIFDRLEQSFAKAERSINIVRLWDQPSVLHSKTMLVDEHLSVVGSVVDELVKAWEADVAWCVEVP